MKQTFDDLLNETEAAEFLHLKPRTLRLWRNRRGLVHYHPTRKVVLYRKSELLDWLNQHRVSTVRGAR